MSYAIVISSHWPYMSFGGFDVTEQCWARHRYLLSERLLQWCSCKPFGGGEEIFNDSTIHKNLKLKHRTQFKKKNRLNLNTTKYFQILILIHSSKAIYTSMYLNCLYAPPAHPSINNNKK